jgi:hypothetical protein
MVHLSLCSRTRQVTGDYPCPYEPVTGGAVARACPVFERAMRSLTSEETSQTTGANDATERGM